MKNKTKTEGITIPSHHVISVKKDKETGGFTVVIDRLPNEDRSSYRKKLLKRDKDEKLREDLLKLLIDNSEDPEEIKDGDGTFVTYRTAVLINELLSLFKEHIEHTIDILLKWGSPNR